MDHANITDLVRSAMVIATILFVAYKTEWCARQIWRVLRITLPTFGVLVEILLLARAPAFGIAVLVVAGVSIIYYMATYERRRQAKALHDVQCRLRYIGDPANRPLGPYETKLALLESKRLAALEAQAAKKAARANRPSFIQRFTKRSRCSG
jgi:hypothetical protein